MTGNDSQFNNISTHEVCLHVIIMFCAQPDGYANGNFRYSLPPFSREQENATKMNNKYLIHHSSLMGEQLIQDKTGYIFPQDQIKCEILY